MTKKQDNPTVEMIPTDRITVLNPRERNKKGFRQIVDSISKVGLKKPITVNTAKKRTARRLTNWCAGKAVSRPSSI